MSETLRTLKDWQQEADSHKPIPLPGASATCDVKSCHCRSVLENETGWYPIVTKVCDDRLRNIAQACLHYTICGGLNVGGDANGIWNGLPGVQGLFEFVNNNIYLAHRRQVEDYVHMFITNAMDTNNTQVAHWLKGLFISALHSPVSVLHSPGVDGSECVKRVRLE
jgi:hypothetical protein